MHYYKNKATAEKQQRILTILQTLRRTNPTLSYKIARQWSKEYDHNEDFEKFLAEFDSEKVYIFTEKLSCIWGSILKIYFMTPISKR
jgi:hypothetical protein